MIASRRMSSSSCPALLVLLLAALIGLTFGSSHSAWGAGSQDVPRETVILFIGDSLTEGYGVKKQEAFPEVAGRILNEKGRSVRVINGGISGSVTADADRRVRWFLKAKPHVLVLALGGNDGLKGTPPAVIKANLRKAIALAQASKLKILLVGIRVYTNFGPEYTMAFEKVFSELAREQKVLFMPFLLENVALEKDLNQADMKHPNAQGHEIVGRQVAKELEKLL